MKLQCHHPIEKETADYIIMITLLSSIVVFIRFLAICYDSINVFSKFSGNTIPLQTCKTLLLGMLGENIGAVACVFKFIK